MDCLFNKYIPASTKTQIIIRPSSKTFITGLSSSYDETYPTAISHRISVEEWAGIMTRINECLFFYWPCFMCLSFGYAFSVCTLGLSFCVPGARISDARKKLRAEIDAINKEISRNGVKFSLMQKCSTSWIQIDLEDVIAMDTDNSQL
jgi:hypothetical protein